MSRYLDARAVALADGLMPVGFIPPAVARAKRLVDIVVALAGLLLTAPLWPLVMLAIRLESPGGAIFRQLRVGRLHDDHTELFHMLKFRSMCHDAERHSGAVWAARHDARITRVGAVLRATRLDELPQLINVLRGDMSVVGPRPERPGLHRAIEAAVPFYADRTAGLRPGITGLSQVSQGYDRDYDDVRRKLAYDTAYALRLTSLHGWAAADLTIMLRTLTVMGAGRGR